MDVDRDDATEVLIGLEKTDMNTKGKSKLGYNDAWQHPIKVYFWNF